MTQNRSVTIKIEAGSVHRHNDLVRMRFKPKRYFPDWQEGVSALAMSVTDAEGRVSGEDVPCQFEPTLRELAWQTDALPAGTSAYYAVRQTNEPPPKPVIKSNRNPRICLFLRMKRYLHATIFSVFGSLTFGPSMGIMELWFAGLAARTIRITQGFISPTGAR